MARETLTKEAYIKWNTCSKKKTFYTRSSAQNARKRRKKVYGGTQRVYECPYCACFHITTKPLESVGVDNGKRD